MNNMLNNMYNVRSYICSDIPESLLVRTKHQDNSQ